MDKAHDAWADFLRPDKVRALFSAFGIYLMAHETLVDSIIRRPREFFSEEWTPEKGWAPNERYAEEVLALDPRGKRDPLRGSVEWLKKTGAIDHQDCETLRHVTDTRNKIAHELRNILGGSAEFHFQENLPKLIALLLKVDRWWIKNVEIPTDSDLADIDVSDDDITPGSIMMLQILQQVALGEDDEAWELHRMFVEKMSADSRRAKT